MALTLTVTKRYNLGSTGAKAFQVTGDAAYPAGGYPLSKTLLGLALTPDLVIPENAWDSATGQILHMQYDRTNATLRFFYPQGGSGSGTNNGLGTVATGAVAVTSTAATADIDTAPGKEVATGANLSAYVGYILVIGE